MREEIIEKPKSRLKRNLENYEEKYKSYFNCGYLTEDRVYMNTEEFKENIKISTLIA